MAVAELTLALIWLAAIPVGLYAFVHACRQRTDAFTATDRLTKRHWLALTGASTVVLVWLPLGGPGTVLWLAGLVAVLVYIVDVKPAVTEVQNPYGRF